MTSSRGPTTTGEAHPGQRPSAGYDSGPPAWWWADGFAICEEALEVVGNEVPAAAATSWASASVIGLIGRPDARPSQGPVAPSLISAVVCPRP